MEQPRKLSEQDAIRVAHMQYDMAIQLRNDHGTRIVLAPREQFVKNRAAELVVSATEGEMAMAKGQK